MTRDPNKEAHDRFYVASQEKMALDPYPYGSLHLLLLGVLWAIAVIPFGFMGGLVTGGAAAAMGGLSLCAAVHVTGLARAAQQKEHNLRCRLYAGLSTLVGLKPKGGSEEDLTETLRLAKDLAPHVRLDTQSGMLAIDDNALIRQRSDELVRMASTRRVDFVPPPLHPDRCPPTPLPSEASSDGQTDVLPGMLPTLGE